ncbi:MAG: type II secretion system protein [Candidatus Saccharimonadaceae bacterium]|nr:type II secretion system protein [Candidatus Saccharimonadaceae bacterium]
MKPSKEAGFTIIETMLFLAITAFLIVGILIGTGTSINRQRYRDSVSSLQSFFQQQYSEVANVENDRQPIYKCDSSNVEKPLGQSDCFILGKFISSDSSDSGKLIIKGVLGTTTPTNSNNDVSAFIDSHIIVSPVGEDSYDLEWRAKLTDKTSGHPSLYISMLILRSPSSGVIRTFIKSSTDPAGIVQDGNISSLLDAKLLKGANVTTMCVDSNGLFMGAMSALVISPDATGSSGIETLGAISGC